MKKNIHFFDFIISLIFTINAFAQNTEIINGIDGTMDGTGPNMVFISLVHEYPKDGQLTQERRSCSGSIIAKNVILTAAHCFGLTKDEITKINYINIYFTLDKNKHTQIAFISKKFIVHPHFNDTRLIYSSSLGYLDNDIALIYFSEQLPKGYAVAEHQKEDDLFLLGQEFRTAGYGYRYDHNNPLTGMPSSLGRLMSTKLRFDSELPDQQLFKTQFSAEQITTGVCQGDSGGAAFIRSRSGLFKIVGINSSAGTEKSCLNSKSYFTRIYLFKDWIDQTISKLIL